MVDAIVDHPDRGLRFSLACNLALSPQVRSRFAADPDPGVRARLVEECNYRWQVLTREPRMPLTVEAYELLAVDPEPKVREEVALQRYTPAHVRELLAADPDPGVRMCLTFVAELAADPDPEVRLAVSRRPVLTEEQRAAIDYSDDPGRIFRPLAWVTDACDDEAMMRRCATSAHPALRRSAAHCPHLSADVVQARDCAASPARPTRDGARW